MKRNFSSSGLAAPATFIRRNFFIFTLITVAIFFSKIMIGQATSSDVTYYGITYIKSSPGKQDAYINLVRNYRKKISEQRFKAGNIIGWYQYQVVMPLGSSAEYNYIGVTVTKDYNTLFEDAISPREPFRRYFPGVNADNILSQFNQVRTIVKREIFTNVAWAVQPTGNPAKFAEVVYQQPQPGKQADYEKWENENWGPIHRAAIELGTMKNWGVFRLYMPYDSHTEYSNLTINFFDDLKNKEEDFRYDEALQKAWPRMDFTNLWGLPGADKKVDKNELLRLVEYVDGSNTRK